MHSYWFLAYKYVEINVLFSCQLWRMFAGIGNLQSAANTGILIFVGWGETQFIFHINNPKHFLDVTWTSAVYSNNASRPIVFYSQIFSTNMKPSFCCYCVSGNYSLHESVTILMSYQKHHTCHAYEKDFVYTCHEDTHRRETLQVWHMRSTSDCS